jgi:hypothetical protein
MHTIKLFFKISEIIIGVIICVGKYPDYWVVYHGMFRGMLLGLHTWVCIFPRTAYDFWTTSHKKRKKTAVYFKNHSVLTIPQIHFLVERKSYDTQRILFHDQNYCIPRYLAGYPPKIAYLGIRYFPTQEKSGFFTDVPHFQAVGLRLRPPLSV